MTSQVSIAFIGFGEAGLAIAETLSARGLVTGMRAHDVKLTDHDPEIAAAMRARIEGAGVTAYDTARDAVEAADIVICVVTADQAAHAASLAAQHLRANALWLDMNSCAPGTKQMASAPVGAAGVTYVDVAVMAPITPRGHETPMLAAAEDTEMVAARLQATGIALRFVGTEIGRASTIKMLRSVMVKGMEALTVECFRAAVRAGVADEVAGSLDASEKGLKWAEQTSYNLERMAAHGIRRAAEMREVAKTLRALEISPAMTTGTIAWQEDMGHLDLTLEPGTALAQQMELIEQAFTEKD
jgi:3-hydroxyisobutyrate dehydrogenase-like beta-hydroxyacid dehydrogenase